MVKYQFVKLEDVGSSPIALNRRKKSKIKMGPKLEKEEKEE